VGDVHVTFVHPSIGGQERHLSATPKPPGARYPPGAQVVQRELASEVQAIAPAQPSTGVHGLHTDRSPALSK
jgi:hypothetical protein